MLSQKLKELREQNGLKQREIAAKLEVDTAYISKMESREKPISRTYLSKLAKLFKTSEKQLLILWLSDKVFDTVNGEKLAEDCLELTLKRVRKK